MVNYRLGKRTIGIGLGVGVCHLLAVALVWVWLASTTSVPMGVDNPSVVLTYPLSTQVHVVGTVIGLIVLGMVPTVLFLERRLLAPAIIVALWFAWGVYATWEAIQWSHLLWIPPLDLYVLGGSWALVTAVLGGIVEDTAHRLRPYLDRISVEG